MDDIEFPDELDLPLQQKLYVAKMLLEQYNQGRIDMAGVLKDAAKKTAASANLIDAKERSFAQGQMELAKLGETILADTDLEDRILEVQSRVLRDHKPKKPS